MKDLFHGFYELSEKDEKEMFLSEKTIFVFDTNCFFNLYRCEENTRKEVMNAIERVKGRIWFPFQICFEYQRNRLNVIKNSLSDFSKIETELKKIIQILGTLCGDKLDVQGRYKNLYSDLCTLRDEIKNDINLFITNKIKLKLDENDYISKSDDVRKWLETLSKNKIGEALKQDQVDKINKIGERRYKYKVGPGWGDDNKKQEYYFNGVFYSAKYGDLYIWNEILNKSEEDDVNSIIFITNDVKSDWWYKLDNSDDVYGPLEVLKTELMNRGNCTFKMYTQTSFLQSAENYFENIKIKESTINEIEYIGKTSALGRHACTEEYNLSDKDNSIDESDFDKETGESINAFDYMSKFMNTPEMKLIRMVQDSMAPYRKQMEIMDKIRRSMPAYGLSETMRNDAMRRSNREWINEGNDIDEKIQDKND